MAETDIKVVGVYNVVPSESSIVEAARYHECDWLLDEDENYIDEINWDNHENLRLVELQFFGDLSPAELLNSIYQGDQVPYMEFWLDAEGSSILAEDEAVATAGRRICFFLHFIEDMKPIEVAGKELLLPPRTVLPARLAPFTHYLPVD